MQGAIRPSKEVGAPSGRDRVDAREIEELLADVPHSAWVIVRYGPDHQLMAILPGPDGDVAVLERLARAEHASLILERSPGQIVRTRAVIAPYIDARTLIIGASRSLHGLFVVLRSASGSVHAS